VAIRNGSVHCRRKKNADAKRTGFPAAAGSFAVGMKDLFRAKPSVQRRAGRADDAENSSWAFGRVKTTTLRVRQDGE
jgi:hypothetical protein